MKKRLIAMVTVLVMLLLVGCTRYTTPDPAVEAFLNTELTAQKAFDAVAQVEYTVRQSRQNKDGEEVGSSDLWIKIDKTDPQALRLELRQDYTGVSVVDGIESEQATIENVDGQYVRTTVRNGETKQENVEEQFVLDYITSFFYMDNGAYNEGGLYYGDFFMIYIYKYPTSSFSVDTEANQCIFNEKLKISQDETGDVRLHQITKINTCGLLESNYERYESVNQDFVLVSQLQAAYVFA